METDQCEKNRGVALLAEGVDRNKLDLGVVRGDR